MKNVIRGLMLVMLLSVVGGLQAQTKVSYDAQIQADGANAYLDTLLNVETHFFEVNRTFTKKSDIIFTINTVENITGTFTGVVLIEAQYTNDTSVPWQDADDLEVVSGTVDANAVEGNAQSFQVEGAVGRRYRLSVLNATSTENSIQVGVRVVD